MNKSLKLYLYFVILIVFCFFLPLTGNASITKNLLIISIDTWREDHSGAAGNNEIRTPSIDYLAKRGVFFSNVFTACPLTAPAHASMLTGLYPFHHGIRDNRGFYLKKKGIKTLAEIMKEKGYFTAALVSSTTLARRYRLNRGFDEYNFVTEDIAVNSFIPISRKGEDVLNACVPYLKMKKPYFIFLHFFDPHVPYAPPEQWKKEYKDDLYSGEIAYDDSLIGKIIQLLKQQKLFKKTLIVLTSDHGEGLGEHGEQTHGLLTYDPTLHIPLIFSGINNVKKLSNKAEEITSIVDIVPTVLDLLFKGMNYGFDGRSLLKAEKKRSIYFEDYFAYLNLGIGGIVGIIYEKYKLHKKPKNELYNLDSDALEINNIFETKKKIVASLQKKLEAFDAKAPVAEVLDVSAEVSRQLESLGYLHGDLGAGKLYDPADFSGDSALWYKARSFLLKGKPDKAKLIYEKLITRYPKSSFLLDELGMVYIAKNNINAAQKMFYRSIQFNSKNYNALIHLANCFNARNDVKNAANYYGKVLQIYPANIDALYNMGVLYYRIGKFKKAKYYFRKFLSLSPNSTDADKIRNFLNQ